MATQLDVLVRNAMLDAIETQIGTSPHLKIRTGAAPANTAASDSGTVLVDITQPSDWMAAASGGSKAKSGTWQFTGAAAGTAAHYRIYDSGGTCRLQGTVTLTAGGGDMTLDNTNIAVGQVVTVTSYAWTQPNA
jgi:hypothetical protein